MLSIRAVRCAMQAARGVVSSGRGLGITVFRLECLLACAAPHRTECMHNRAPCCGPRVRKKHYAPTHRIACNVDLQAPLVCSMGGGATLEVNNRGGVGLEIISGATRNRAARHSVRRYNPKCDVMASSGLQTCIRQVPAMMLRLPTFPCSVESAALPALCAQLGAFLFFIFLAAGAYAFFQPMVAPPAARWALVTIYSLLAAAALLLACMTRCDATCLRASYCHRLAHVVSCKG